MVLVVQALRYVQGVTASSWFKGSRPIGQGQIRREAFSKGHTRVSEAARTVFNKKFASRLS